MVLPCAPRHWEKIARHTLSPVFIAHCSGMKAEQLIWREAQLSRLPVAPARRQQFALNEAETLALGAQLVRIEALHQSPQDVEWAHDGQELFILQARPVTTTSKAASR